METPPGPIDDRPRSEHDALPRFELAQLQCDWLRGARSRLLRSASIQRAEHIVDLGCGWGSVTLELARRSAANVVGVDQYLPAIEFATANRPDELVATLSYVCANAAKLPWPERSVDIVFSQCALMWMHQLEAVIDECHRVLRPGGALVMIEPDYGGLMEWPESISTRSLWLQALSSAGADAQVGRRLMTCLDPAVWQVDTFLTDRYEPPLPRSLDFLRELLSRDEDLVRLRQIEQARNNLPAHRWMAHLPFWMLIARRRV